MKQVIAVSLLLCAVIAVPQGPSDLGGMFAQESASVGDLPEDHFTRQSCQSRRGFGECRNITSDCETTSVSGQMQVNFPALEVSVDFPCSEPFHNIPMVMLNVLGPDNSKLYAASLKHATNAGFKANIQRVDDTEDPVMTCDAVQLCYIALAV